MKVLLLFFLSFGVVLAEDELDYSKCAKDLNNRIRMFHDRQVLVPPSLPTVVKTGMAVVKVKGIEDEFQKLTMTVLFTMQWNDWRIATDDLQCRTLSSKFVLEATKYLPWYPHFTVKNSANQVLFEDGWRYYPSLIYANGTINWIQEYQIETVCPLTITMFPFDNQFCNVEIEMPHYKKGVIRFEVVSKSHAVQIVSKDSALAPVWSLVGQSYEYMDNSPGINFKVQLQRRPTFYLCSLMFPTLVINIMTAATFISTPGFEEKPQLAQSCMLAYLLLNLVFYNFVPTSSNSQPLLVIFFAIQNFLALGCFFAVAMIYRTDYIESMHWLQLNSQNNEAVVDDGEYEDKKFFEDTKAMNGFVLLGYLALVTASYIGVIIFFILGSIQDNEIASAGGFVEPRVASRPQ